MKDGGWRRKGQAFERTVCTQLSEWVSFEKRDDLFWRAAASGGRATTRHRLGKSTRAQSGDIAAVTREAVLFADTFFIECKHVADLAILGSLLHGRGLLMKFWGKLRTQAKHHHKAPLLIARQNNWPTIALLKSHHAPTYFGAITDKELFRAYLLDPNGVSVYLLDDLLSLSYRADRFVKK